MIHVGYTELKAAFKAHYDAAQISPKNRSPAISYYLLLFYATESGLKSIYLKQTRINSTENLEESILSKDGHNLARWIKELKIPASIARSGMTHFHLEREPSKDRKSYDISNAHQAWRYGIRIVAEDEDQLVAWLQDLCKWIKENIK